MQLKKKQTCITLKYKQQNKIGKLGIIKMKNLCALKDIIKGSPWWLSGKESAGQCRRHGFDLWSRKNPHAAGQLGLCTSTTEPMFQSLGAETTEPTCSTTETQTLQRLLCNKRGHCSEQHMRHNQREAPICHNQRKVCTATKTQHSQINKIIFLKKTSLSEKTIH